MTEIVLPSHANALGTIFGGQIVSWMDIAGAITAGRHARKIVVTASIDALHFLAPVRVGNIVHIRAAINFVGKTSMEVGIRADAENPITGERTHTASAYMTFVALDADGKATGVPAYVPVSDAEKRRHAQALIRKESRLKLAQQLKASAQSSDG